MRSRMSAISKEKRYRVPMLFLQIKTLSYLKRVSGDPRKCCEIDSFLFIGSGGSF
jgi:hypothetical protein